MGQGLKTVLAQIAADQVGVRPEDITVVSGDTATIQLGLGGFASRQTVTAGNSVHLAARAVREKAIAAAALILGVPEQNLDIRDGIVMEIGKNLSISLRDIANTQAGAPGYQIPSGLAPGCSSGRLPGRSVAITNQSSRSKFNLRSITRRPARTTS